MKSRRHRAIEKSENQLWDLKKYDPINEKEIKPPREKRVSGIPETIKQHIIYLKKEMGDWVVDNK